MVKRVIENSVVSSALNDLKKTLSALDRSKKGLRAKVNELNKADENYKIKKSKLRDQIADLIKKEKLARESRIKLNSKRNKIAEKMNKVSSLKHELEGI